MRTKAMDEAVEVDTPEGGVQVTADEPMGAQFLRRIHENCLLLMEEYDDHLKLQDHPEVKKFAVELLEHCEDTLQTIEDMFAREYPDGKALTDEAADDAEEAGSTPEELPSAEESVEGMELDEKSFHRRRAKSYYGYGKKGGSDKLRGKNKPGQIRAIWHEDPDGDYHPDAKALTEDEAAELSEELVEQTADTEEKSLICSKDMDMLSGASGFLQEASEYSGDWSDEMRTKAGHWHKQVGPLGQPPADLGTDSDDAEPGEMGQKGFVVAFPSPGGERYWTQKGQGAGNGQWLTDLAAATHYASKEEAESEVRKMGVQGAVVKQKSMDDDELNAELDKREKSLAALEKQLESLLK